MKSVRLLGPFFITIGIHWRAFLTGALLESVGLFYYQSKGGMIPNWAWLTIGAVGLLFAAFRAWQTEREAKEAETARATSEANRYKLEIELLNRRLHPPQELVIQCGRDVPDSVVQPDALMTYEVNGVQHTDNGRWYRIVIHAKGTDPVSECWGAITALDGCGKSLRFDGSILTWAPGTWENPPKTIRRTPTEKLDVLRISEDGVIVFGTPGAGAKWNYEPANFIFATKGDYTLTVVLNAKGVVPYVLTLEFKWRENWNDSELTLKGMRREI